MLLLQLISGCHHRRCTVCHFTWHRFGTVIVIISFFFPNCKYVERGSLVIYEISQTNIAVISWLVYILAIRTAGMPNS